MQWTLLNCAVAVLILRVNFTESGLVEVDRDGALLHFTPVSSSSHWLLPSFPNDTHLTVGPGTVLVTRGEHDKSIFITLVGALPPPVDVSHISTLVRCELGCDARLEAVAFNEQCQIVAPPACVRLIPKFRRLVLCMRTGEFLTDSSVGPPFVSIDNAVDAARLVEKEPYIVTFDC